MKKTILLLSIFISLQSSAQTGAANIDFETGNFSGWQLSKGNNSNSQLPLISITTVTAGVDVPANNCSPSTEHSIMTSSLGVDPISLQTLNSPLGGKYVARLNSFCASQKGAILSKTISINLTNYLIYVAYMIVLESPTSHNLADQTYFKYDVIDGAGSVISNTSYSSLDPSKTFADFLPAANAMYKPWTLDSVNLQSYIGQNVTLRLIAAGCPQYSHSGFAYVDAGVKSFATNIEQNSKPAINVHPNPTNELLFLSLLPSDNMQFEVTDILSRVVMKQTCVLDSTLDVSNLSQGTYILKGELNGRFIALKFIKN